MPIWYRKSLKIGPARINLSTGGVGASVGVRGLRLGVNRRGTYIRASREGFVYYQQISSSRSQPSAETTGNDTPEKKLSVIAPDAVIADWRQQMSRPRYAASVISAAGLTILVGLLRHSTILAGVGVVILVVGGLLAQRERHYGTVDAAFELDDEQQGRYAKLVNAFNKASNCSQIWTVTDERFHGDAKHNSGADITEQRQAIRISVGVDRIISTNLAVPMIQIPGDERLLFLPDRIVQLNRRNVGEIPYSAVTVTAKYSRFVVTDSVPSDANVVDYTWSHPNRDGGPDRRFHDNRKLPIANYSDLILASPNYTVTLQFSKNEAAEDLATALRDYGLTGASARPPAPPEMPSVTISRSRLRSAVELLDERLPKIASRLFAITNQNHNVVDVSTALAALRAAVTSIRPRFDALNQIIASRFSKSLADESPDALTDWIHDLELYFDGLAEWKRDLSSAPMPVILRTARRNLACTADDVADCVREFADRLRPALDGGDLNIAFKIHTPHLARGLSDLDEVAAPST